VSGGAEGMEFSADVGRWDELTDSSEESEDEFTHRLQPYHSSVM
jgi:hypothetical protein